MNLRFPFLSWRRKALLSGFPPAGGEYISHFGFQERPFQAVPGPGFLWLGESWKKALDQLRYEILYGDGIVVITGDVGAGKSTLAKMVVNRLALEARAALVSCPGGFEFDIYRLASSAFGNAGKAAGEADSPAGGFDSFLHDSFLSGRPVVLILDEAQNLIPSLLEQLLHLAGPGEGGRKRMKLVLVGENDLQQKLAEVSPGLGIPPVSFHYHLPPLDWEQTRDYILHRLRAARSHRGVDGLEGYVSPRQRNSRREREIFSPAALKEVFLYSAGVPRLINTLCDSVLLSTCMEGRVRVLSKTVASCAQELHLPPDLTEGDEKVLPAAPPLEEAPEPETNRMRVEEGGPGDGKWLRKNAWPSWYYSVFILVSIFLILFVFGLWSSQKNFLPGSRNLAKSPMGRPPSMLPAKEPAAGAPASAGSKPAETVGKGGPDVPEAGEKTAGRGQPEEMDPGKAIEWLLQKKPAH